MKGNSKLDIEKVVAIGEEIEASFNFIKEGIRYLNNQNSAKLNNHVPLQLFSSGFERLAKILLLLKEKHVTGNYPITEGTKNYFVKYDNGHGINKMIDELIAYAETVELMNNIPVIIEDMEFIKSDNKFRSFLNIMSDFSRHQRYYYVDTIVKKERQDKNSFEEYISLVYSYSNEIDVTELTYDEEERYILTSMIITIEKGVRAISRLFTHGLGDEGRMHYGKYSSFFFLKDEELGKLKYLIPKIDPQKDYKPISIFSVKFLKIRVASKTKTVYSVNFTHWPFFVSKVEVFNCKNGLLCFVRIKCEVFALNGSASSHFEIPDYTASKYSKPRQFLPDLLTIAQNL